MRNIEIWSETEIKWSENEMKKKQKLQSEKGQSENLGKSVRKRRKILSSSFNLSSLYPFWSETKMEAKRSYEKLLKAKQSKNTLF
jgi:hypothetical protein